MAVLPYARSGMVSGAMLGLGRALGETIAVLLVLSSSGGVSFNLIGQANPSTIPANIAGQFAEATGVEVNLLVLTGLVLFVADLRGQLRGTRRARAPGRLRRSCRMTTATRPRPRRTARAPARARTARCPRWAPLALGVAVALALALASAASLGGGPITTGARRRAAVHGASLSVLSRAVEGRRRAADRTVTTVVTAMFLATLVPLVSVLYTVISRGLARFDPEFFSLTMRNVVGAGGGAQHAIVGHAGHHRAGRR